jgi:hypothetical protein
MRVGATSLKKLIFRLELTRSMPPDIAKPNWKGANRKLCGRQRLRTSFLRILREEIAEAGLSSSPTSVSNDIGTLTILRISGRRPDMASYVNLKMVR